MKTESCGATHRGNLREHNEDNIYVDGQFRSDLAKDNYIIESGREQAPYVYGVFDGLGGESYGERASYIAAMMLRKADKMGTLGDFDKFVAAAHRAIQQDASDKGARNMGTTAAVLIIDGEECTVFNVGDSRVYLIRDGQIRPVSKDHSVVQSMIDCGFIDESERATSPHSGELTQYLGMTSEEDIEPMADSQSFSVLTGDIFVLCSDGLHGELTDEEILSVAESDRLSGARYITGDLIRHAVAKTGKDNVSAVVVCIS